MSWRWTPASASAIEAILIISSWKKWQFSIFVWFNFSRLSNGETLMLILLSSDNDYTKYWKVRVSPNEIWQPWHFKSGNCRTWKNESCGDNRFPRGFPRVIIVFVELYGSSRWSFGPTPALESIETTTIGKTHPTLVSMITSIFLYKIEPIPCEAW